MLKSLLLFSILVLCVHFSNATTYYFSSLSGDDARTSVQATNPATPWKTISKFNAIATTLQAGDSVLFNRGEVFYGGIVPKVSGTSAARIYFGAYGTGANPVISGFTTLADWTSYGNGIYYATLTATNLQMVTINGVAKGMGRWPNTGYLQVDSHVGNQSITSTGLSGAPTTNFTGGEVVIRKYRFILDRHTITSESGNTLNYNLSALNGWNGSYSPVDKNGFFVQGHLATLDQSGEWYYNAAAKRLYVYFGASAPANYVVKASTQDYNASLSNISYTTFENLDFEGGNTNGILMGTCSNISITNCNFNNEGAVAIGGKVLSYITVKGCTLNNIFSNGINFDENINNVTVDSVTATNINMIAGTGRSGSGVGNGITVNGGFTNITNNRVIGTGYSGIQFVGDNVLVEKNYVENFCNLKDDGGGIYTFNGPNNATESNRIIRNNIILNAIGNFESVKAYWWESFGKAAGIYLDEYVNHIQITNNTVAGGDWAGIFIHNAHDCQITNNIFYNHRYQVHLSQYTQASRNMVETGNQYIAKQAFQTTWFYRSYVSDSVSLMGTSNNNYFARPLNDGSTIRIGFLQNSGGDTTDISLAQWQSQYGLDLNSKKSPLTYTGNINDSLRFEYNASSAVRTIALDAAYIDVAGNQYSGTLSLNPWTSVVLFKTKTTTTVAKQNQTITFPAIPGKTYGDPAFTLNASASSGLPVSYRVVSGPATVSGNTVTITGAGTVTIEASQSGNSAYNAATPVQQSFAVVKAAQAISFGALANKTYGDAPFQVNASASSGLPVSFRVVSGPATVSGNTVTLTGTGTVVIEASQAGDANYNAATPVQQSFMVSSASTTKQNQTITFGTLAYKTCTSPPFELTATASSGLPVSYRVVSGPITISGNVVTIKGVGLATIEASQAGNASYNAATPVQRSFNIGKAGQTITFASIPNKTYGDPPFTLNATASSGLPVAYRVVSGPATVSGNTVTLTGAGTVTIEASQPGNECYSAAYSPQRSFTVAASQVTVFRSTTRQSFMKQTR